MIHSLRLPFQFNVERLRQDLATAAKFASWEPHYNEQEYGGAWSGIALRSAGGNFANINAAPIDTEAFRDTPLLGECPYFREVLAVFACALKAVRLLGLEPGSFIREHSDFGLSYDDGEIRVHVPIETNSDVEFYVAGERLLLEPGHSYFLNVNLPHRVNNRGKSARVHLVIDAAVNDWVRELFERGLAEQWAVPRTALPPRNIDEFRVLVLNRPEIQDELRRIERVHDFGDRATAIGNAHGFDFHDGDLDAALQCGPIRAGGDWVPSGPGWTPVHVDCAGAEPLVTWLYTDTLEFREPFFEDSIRVALRNPFARMFQVQTTLETARRRVEDAGAADPAGFIFHVSRCGSTLVSQMLGAAGYKVISEAPAIDEVLAAGSTEWLRVIVRALGAGGFVKLDAWHNRWHRLIRAAFPETPWIFLYRDPVEVLISQLTKPGLLSIPESGVTREEWCARVFEGIYEAGAAVSRDPKCIRVDYRELPGAVYGAAAAHFGIDLSPEQTERMTDAAQCDAKNPGVPFEPDVERKRQQASAAVAEICARRLDGLYREISREKIG